MNRIKDAHFMRATEIEGRLVAEVEFSIELTDRPEGNMKEKEGAEQKFIAVLENDGGQSYRLRHVYKNDSNMALDWYDNAEHQAYTDVTNSMFGDSHLNKDRESFVLDMLDCEGVRMGMESGRES